MLEVLMELINNILAAKKLLRYVLADKYASIIRSFAFRHYMKYNIGSAATLADIYISLRWISLLSHTF